MKLYYSDALCTLLHGNADEYDPSPFTRLVLTDPPYGINYKSGHNKNKNNLKGASRDENFPSIQNDHAAFNPQKYLNLNCKPKLAFFGGNYCADNLPASRCWVVWNKRAGKTPSTQADCEMVWTNFDKPSRVFDHLWRGIMRAGEENVSRSPKLHPHQKPVALLSYLIDYADIAPNETNKAHAAILDPYCGSASTLVAARRKGIASIGIDIDEQWLEVAAKRLEREALAAA